MEEKKRLFWGFPFGFKGIPSGACDFYFPLEIDLPSDGRQIESRSRHATAVFLGNINPSSLDKYLGEDRLRLPSLGLAGILKDVIVLPSRGRPRVVAATGLLTNRKNAESIVSALAEQMRTRGCSVSERRWLFHVTLARAPFSASIWQKLHFMKIFHVTVLHLYESKPGLKYSPVYTHSFLPLFEYKIDGENIRMKIRGEDFTELFYHSLFAMNHLALKNDRKTQNSLSSFISSLLSSSSPSLQDIGEVTRNLDSISGNLSGNFRREPDFEGGVLKQCEWGMEWSFRFL